MNDKEFLYWIITRLTNMFGDDPNADFIHRLKNISNNIEHLERLSTELGIRVRLGELFSETKVDTWLNTINPAFDNKKPIQLIEANNFAPIYEMIYKVGSGEPLS